MDIYEKKILLRKDAKKTAKNTITWHCFSAIATLFMLYLFRSSTFFCITLGIIALIECGLVALAVLSYKTRMEEIDEMQE